MEKELKKVGLGISYYILWTRNINYGAGELRQEGEMTLLTGGPRWRNSEQSMC